MINKWFKEGVTCKAFLDSENEEIKARALKRWDTMVMTTEQMKDIKSLDEHLLIAFMELTCPDAMVLLPYLAKIEELNPKLHVRVLKRSGHEDEMVKELGHPDPRVPTVLIYDKDGRRVGKMEEYPLCFLKRLKGLDAEDTEELVKRYRRGYYNTEIIKGLIALFE